MFVVVGELTLFMQGIVDGKNVMRRLGNPRSRARIKAGEHNEPLNEFLTRASDTVRKVFQGKLTYASLTWEAVDWSLFDFVSIDHYWADRIKDRYVEMLKPLFAYGKLIEITEFGARTFQGVGITTEGLGGDIIDHRSVFLHRLPLLGRFVRARLVGEHVRDEGWQARQFVDQLGLLDSAGVDGAFVQGFVSYRNPFDDDSDMTSTWRATAWPRSTLTTGTARPTRTCNGSRRSPSRLWQTTSPVTRRPICKKSSSP